MPFCKIGTYHTQPAVRDDNLTGFARAVQKSRTQRRVGRAFTGSGFCDTKTSRPPAGYSSTSFPRHRCVAISSAVYRVQPAVHCNGSVDRVAY